MTKLEFVRRNSGLSQLSLAREVGIHPTAIVQVERGHRKPWPKFRTKVSAGLKLDEYDLFDVNGWPTQMHN